MKLQMLVPQYKETEEVIKPLLDSIAIQQNIDFENDIGVIIVNDGSDVKLSSKFLKSYPYKIEYYEESHRGVSATRNACLDHATADYVMFCDADDMFLDVSGLFLLFKEMATPFDSLSSIFIEEKHALDGKIEYIRKENDSTFVHGKVHRLQFLIDRNIRWNEDLQLHEDSYFNILCQSLGERVLYMKHPFYLWKYRKDSVCREDPEFIVKTFHHLVDSNEACIEALINRGKVDVARNVAFQMLYYTYFNANKADWLKPENAEYVKLTETKMGRYYQKYKKHIDGVDPTKQVAMISSAKNKMYAEGLVMESITFDDWVKKCVELANNEK